jgi:hypothetical protein
VDPEEAQTIYDELGRRYSAWGSAAITYFRTALSAGAANQTDAERAELAALVPSMQASEQDLKLEYREYKAHARQRLQDVYVNLVAQIAATLTQHDPYNLVPGSDGPTNAQRADGTLSEVPDEYRDMALWIALRLSETTTKKEIGRNIHNMYGVRRELRGRHNRPKRMAIASSVWEVWQSVRAQVSGLAGADQKEPS